jgi:acetyl-CoA carboxylase biotin carboxyl carrier protein
MSLTYAQVEEILRIIEEFPAAEIRFEYQDLKLYVRRTGAENPHSAGPVQAVQAAAVQAPAPAETVRPQAAPPSVPAERKKPKKTAPAEHKGLVPVHAPMTGVFYRAPAPGAEPFVKVGQMVSTGTDLCIIEVMKVMNLIKAPCAGMIVEIEVENAAMVELDQPLMWIRP